MSGEPPNIVFLVLDTARAKNFSCYGHERETTPRLSEFAGECVKFERATSVSPWTLPSHASLFTGTPPSTHRTNSFSSSLPESTETLAEVLHRNGYRTVGMSANPWLSADFGVTRGFEEFHNLVGPFDTDTYRSFVNTLTDGSKPPLGRVRELVTEYRPSELCRNSLTAAYRQFIGRNDNGAKEAVERSKRVIDSSRPFFLFVNFLEPHLPFEPPEDYARTFIDDSVSQDRLDGLNHDAPAYNIRNVNMSEDDFELLERLYDAEIRYVDSKIGELLDSIERNGSRRNTLVIVTGDHGENIGDHGLMAHHYSLHETLTHVPLLIRYADEFSGGRTVDARVSSLDVPATVCDILSDEGVVSNRFLTQQTGKSLRSVTSDRRIFAEYLNPMPPIDRMRERCENADFDVSIYDRTIRAVYDDSMKLVRHSDGDRQLFDLDVDYGETMSILEDQPGTVEELEQELDDWIADQRNRTTAGTGASESVEQRLGELGYL